MVCPRRRGCGDYKARVVMAFLKASGVHGMLGFRKRLKKDANGIHLGETETPRSEHIMGTPEGSSRAEARGVPGRRGEGLGTDSVVLSGLCILVGLGFVPIHLIPGLPKSRV